MNTNKRGMGRDDLLLADEVYAVIEAAMEVHSKLGAGFLEAVYQEAMGIKLRLRGIAFHPQCAMQIKYKGHILEKEYCADFLCCEQIIVEIKAMKELTSREESQLLNYLKATGHRARLLVNFGDPGRLDWKRLIL